MIKNRRNYPLLNFQRTRRTITTNKGIKRYGGLNPPPAGIVVSFSVVTVAGLRLNGSPYYNRSFSYNILLRVSARSLFWNICFVYSIIR